MDDLAVLLRAQTQDELQVLIETAFQAVHEAASKRGLQLNMEAGKTEVLRAFVGKGAKKAKQELVANNFVIPIRVGNEELHLRVVQSYKHLGGWVHSDGKPKHALKERVRTAKQAAGPLIQPFFKKKNISSSTKVQVFESLVMSRMLFNVQALTRVTQKEVDEWEAAMRSMIPPLASCNLRGLPPFTFTTATLCCVLGMIPPSDLLHIARLRYLPRLLIHCPGALWSLMQEGDGAVETSWTTSLRSSLAWLCTFAGPRLRLSPEADLNDWWMFIKLDQQWTTRAKKAAKSCRECRRETAEATVWERSFELDLLRDGALADLDVTEQQAASWICETCQAEFASKKALSVHAMKMHSYRSLVSHYVTDSSCPNCAKNFTHRPRLATHLQAVPSCFERVKACFPPLRQEVMHEMAEEDKKHARSMKSQGWLKTQNECIGSYDQGVWTSTSPRPPPNV